MDARGHRLKNGFGQPFTVRWEVKDIGMCGPIKIVEFVERMIQLSGP
jgi:hypothetical protein